MDLQKLRNFVAVAECGSVSRAALLIHMSQSPLSRQMALLEQRLGLTLFIRENKRLRLSQVGQDFLIEAKALLAHADRLESDTKALALGHAGQIAIGYVEGALHLGVLQSALQRLQKNAPNARIELFNLRSAQQHLALKNGTLDVGFAYSTPANDLALNSTVVAEDHCVLALPRNHPLATGKLPLAQLSEQAFIDLPERVSPSARIQLIAACGRCGFVPNIRYEVADPSTALSLVAAGMGLCIIQSHAKRLAPKGVVFRNMPVKFNLSVQIVRISPRFPQVLVQKYLID